MSCPISWTEASSGSSSGRFVACDRPSPRCHCSLTEVEPGRLLLFGGEIFNGRKFTCFQDVYELSLSLSATISWRRLELPGGAQAPRARSAHQAVAWKGGLYILGGEWADATQDKIQQFKDIWCLTSSGADSASWEQVPAEKGFSQRSGHRACLHDGAIVTFGGYREDADGEPTYLNDVHRFDLAQRKFRKMEDLSGAAPKGRSAAQVWSDGEVVWVYGGSTPAPKQKGVKEHMDALRDLWRLEPGKWSSGPVTIAGGGPGQRSSCASAPLLPAQPNLRLFFGGVTDRFGQKKEEVSAFHNDTWVLDTKALAWSRLELSAPGSLQGRIGAQLVPVAAPGRAELFVLFGGMAEAGPREVTMDDLWCICEPPAAKSAEGVAATPVSKEWSCLLPLSDKTKTWFPDNDGDSSDEETAEPSGSKSSKKAGKKAKAKAGKADKDDKEDKQDLEDDDWDPSAKSGKQKTKDKKGAKKSAAVEKSPAPAERDDEEGEEELDTKKSSKDKKKRRAKKSEEAEEPKGSADLEEDISKLEFAPEARVAKKKAESSEGND